MNGSVQKGLKMLHIWSPLTNVKFHLKIIFRRDGLNKITLL